MIVNYETKVVANIAKKHGKLSALMYNAAYEKSRLNFLQVPFIVDDIEMAVSGIRGLNIRGATVSTPYKVEVMNYLDYIDPIAKKIGAVNTIINKDGKLTGYNSDWIGAMAALEEKISLKGKTVLLFGAGGAARAIAYGLSEKGAHATIINRSPNKAKELSKTFGLSWATEASWKGKRADVIINATTVGHGDPHVSVVKEEFLHPGQVVMDIVFDPVETRLLKMTKKRKGIPIPGYRMLIYQALFQLELFTGQKIPFSVVEKGLLPHLS
jgi:shikimate dehydrogenase